MSSECMQDGVSYAKSAFIYTTFTLSLTYASILYDWCKAAIASGGSLPLFFASYAAINIMMYFTLTFCQALGRHSTLNAIDVGLSAFAALWIYIGAFVHLLKQHSGAPDILKILSSVLTILAFIAAHFIFYDRKVRKMAPTVTGGDGDSAEAANKNESGEDGKSEVSV